MTDNVVELPQGASQDASRGSVASPEPTGAPDRFEPLICDRQFMDDVTQLKALRSYMIRQAKIVQAGTIELGSLNLLRFDENGRFPTHGEWADLEHRSGELYQHLPEQDRRRFLYGQIPLFVIRIAAALGYAALISLLVAVVVALFLPDATGTLLMFFSFLLWVASLGGIGSIAFIGMNALAVQDDATFDITNEKLIGLRVVLGALFAVVLTLPFGFVPFVRFVDELVRGSGDETPSALAVKSALLLLPFVLGFSTTLVIMILNQFVEAVQSFFGKRSSPPPAASPGAAPPPVAGRPPASRKKSAQG